MSSNRLQILHSITYKLVKNMLMANKQTVENLSRNLKMLLEIKDWKPKDLAKASGISPRTVAYAVNGEKTATIETVAALAKPFGLNGWHLIMPNLDESVLTDPAIRDLYVNYTKANKDGRKMIATVAEREATYGDKAG